MDVSTLLAWSPFDPWHLLVIGVIALLFFGKRLPDVGRSLGRGISEFKKGLRDVREELDKDDEPPDPPRNKLQPPDNARTDAPSASASNSARDRIPEETGAKHD